MDLRALGQETAEKVSLDGRCSGKRAVGKLHRGVKRVEETQKRLSQKSWDRLPTAVEWLLDNTYLVRREGMSAQEEIKRGKRQRT